MPPFVFIPRSTLSLTPKLPHSSLHLHTLPSLPPQRTQSQQCRFHYDGDKANAFLCGAHRCPQPRTGCEDWQEWQATAAGGRAELGLAASSPTHLAAASPGAGAGAGAGEQQGQQGQQGEQGGQGAREVGRYCALHSDDAARKADAAAWTKPDYFVLHLAALRAEGGGGEEEHKEEQIEGREERREGEDEQEEGDGGGEGP